MDAFNLLAFLVTLAAIFGWLNHRFVKLPATIGLMVITMGFSLLLVALGKAGLPGSGSLTSIVENVDFDAALLDGMLGALLFAGALHIDINELRSQGWAIALLATVGVLICTVLVGTGSWIAFGWMGLDVPFLHALLFGALISPTDPIAVGAILRTTGIPKSLLVKITGESLFNDGIGVVLFVLLLDLAMGQGGHGALTAAGSAQGQGIQALAAAEVSPAQVLHLLGMEVGGGLLFGGVMGWIVYRMLRSLDAYQVEILLTLALVTGGYALAQSIHVSGPLAMVVAGLLIGNRGRTLAMSDRTVRHLDTFWELVDDFLNSVLFVMIGMEIFILEMVPSYLVAGVLAVPLVLASRFLSVLAPISLLRIFRQFTPHALEILTWSGLRGGISVALALSLPPGETRDLLLTATYVVVVFSIVVQGLTVGPLARKITSLRG